MATRCWISAAGIKLRRKAKPGYYIYHSLPASHQAIFFPTVALKKYPYDLQYHVSSDYALAARLYKAGYPFRRINGLVSEFSMGGVSTSNNLELLSGCKKRTAKNITCARVLGAIILFITSENDG
ncbi:glycosyltransferase [Salmonella enterica subsp. enterica]|uniref:Glycosyltransferase n=1 Tax=Salmonella enterica I TaxID=59201 RepID=A0A447N804_SALET|nr:glycosyltransferase [Salmonella enterica subsp. enterica]